MGTELIFRLNPKTNNIILYSVNAPFINVTENNLMFAFQFLDKNFQPFYDDRYFSLELSKFVINRTNVNNETIISSPLKLENCTYHYHKFFNSKRNFSSEFQKVNLKNAFCMSDNNSLIGGAFNSDFFSNLRFSIKSVRIQV